MTTTMEPPGHTGYVLSGFTPSGYNASMFYEVMHQIITDPKSWYQGTWGSKVLGEEAATLISGTTLQCGTTHCFAGWTAVMAGYKPEWAASPDQPDVMFAETAISPNGNKVDIEDVARHLLGLDEDEAITLFFDTMGNGSDPESEIGTVESDIENLWDAVESVTNYEVTYIGYQEWLRSKIAA